MKYELTKKTLPQNPNIEVFVPNYKEPILPVNHGGVGWFGLMVYNEQGQVMCHECGEFRDKLGNHIKKHKLNKSEYRIKYGLMNKSPLCSRIYIDTVRLKTKNQFSNPEKREELLARLAKAREVRISPNRDKNHRASVSSLEYQNKNDTCPAQCLRWLSDAGEIYGDSITAEQANQFRGGLVHLLQSRYGSFNKAKQLVKLNNNVFPYMTTRYSKELIIEDMLLFYKKFGRWAKRPDYEGGLMVCKLRTINRLGGMILLRQQAMKLKDGQSNKAQVDLKQIASKIEMEYAGRARV